MAKASTAIDGLSGNASAASVGGVGVAAPVTIAALPVRAIPRHGERWNGPLDVLEFEISKIVEAGFEPTSDRLVNSAGDHDAARLCLRLQPGRHVHTITVKIVALDDQVAKMQADPEHDGGILRLPAIGLCHGLLELDRCIQGVDSAGKFDEGTIPGQLDQAATLPGQYRLQALRAMGLQASKGAVLVTAHQARIANDVRRQNRRQSTYHPLQVASPKAAKIGGSY